MTLTLTNDQALVLFEWLIRKEFADGLRYFADADEFGDFIGNKHKGPYGAYIPRDGMYGK